VRVGGQSGADGGPFRYALLHPADQNGGRVDPLNIERLIGGEYRDALILQLSFQFQ
jgi:hypothetical protein